MQLRHEYHHGAGATLEAHYAIGYRHDDRWDFDAETGESVVLQRYEGQTRSLLRQQGWLTGLWPSPSGGVVVTYHLGGIYQNPDPTPRKDRWAFQTVDATLNGLWGLDDEHLFAWGANRGKPVVLRRDGRAWRTDPAPGYFRAMHGVAPDIIIAVGRGGCIARWDGRAWTAMASPTAEPLSAVHVVSADEMYACGPNGTLLEGSVYGWSRLVDRGPALNCLARCGETLWVGSTTDGLFRLSGGRIDPVEPNLPARAMHVGTAGIVLTSASRLSSWNGEEVGAELTLEPFVRATRELTPTWIGKGRKRGPGDDPDATEDDRA